MLNLSKYHREHEKYYATAPLRQALALHEASLVLKTMAERWSTTAITTPVVAHPALGPYLGCDDLNEPAAIQHTGVLFLEGASAPPEIGHLIRDLGTLADDFSTTGEWLQQAMAGSWQAALALLQLPALADVLGDRHRIIANDWQAAQASSLVALLLRRALEILGRIDFTPAAVRADLAGPGVFPAYLYAAADLIDQAADIVSDTVSLTHDNDRRWRVFRERVQQLAGVDATPAGRHADKETHRDRASRERDAESPRGPIPVQ